MRRILGLIVVCHLALLAHAQDEREREPDFFFGLGLGLDHGGLGIRLDGRITPNISIMAGGGFNSATLGWNAGLVYRMRRNEQGRPYVSAMYGTNAAVRYEDKSGGLVNGKGFLGPSIGAGIELWSANRRRFGHIGLLFPLRSKEAQGVYDNLKSPQWAVLPTLGIHF